MKLVRVLLTVVILATLATAQGTWTKIARAPSTVSNMWLLRDGRIITHDGKTRNTYIITPDVFGSYANATWSVGPLFPVGYGPYAQSSAMLPDGRLLIMGGENNLGVKDLQGQGAILDSYATYWTHIDPPLDAPPIGDSPAGLLPNGNYLQLVGSWHLHQAMLLNPKTMQWSRAHDTLAKNNDEASITLTWDDTMLQVVPKPMPLCGTDKGTQLYDYSTDTWTCGAELPEILYNQDPNHNRELGSTMQLYTGEVIQFPGDQYTDGLSLAIRGADGTWRKGPIMPTWLSQYDTPSALEPNGKVLAVLGKNQPPQDCQFYEYDPNTESLDWVAGPPVGCGDGQNSRLLTLPTGELLYCHYGSDVWLYRSNNPQQVQIAAPTIYIASLVLRSNTTVQLLGKQLNGLSQAQGYGDDYQAATNYPLVQITDRTGHVYRALTHGDTYSGIAPNRISSTMFDMPVLPVGAYTIRVVTNGIASNSVPVVIGAGVQ